MLNERLEYEDYLSGKLHRFPFHNRMLAEHYSGIRRPLQVLARGFLESCQQQGLSPDASARACRAFLQTWLCGRIPSDFFPSSLDPRLARAFAQAAESSFLFYANSISTQDHGPKLAEMAKAFCQPPYSAAPIPRGNTFNRICFDHILAEALYFGPLQSQCLAVKDSKTLDLSCNEKCRKTALAVVARYLQLQSRIGRDPQREYLPIVQAEIGNWVNLRAKSAGRNSTGSSVSKFISDALVRSTGEALFEKVIMENNMKIRVSPDWLSRQQVMLIPESEAEVYIQQGYRVFLDIDLLANKRTGKPARE